MLLSSWYHLEYFFRDFALYLIFILLSFIGLIFGTIKSHHLNISENKKKFLIALFFSIFCIVLIYSSSEAYFRYRFDEPDSLGFLKVNGRWFQRHVVFNSYFVRDRDFTLSKKEGVTRIGLIGDSIAMGYGIKNVEDRFSNRLEKKLIVAGKKVEVYNLGKSGYDTDTEIAEYNKSFKNLNLDIVIWEYFLNDAQPNDRSTGTRILIREKAQNNLAKSISNYSYFFDYVYWRLASRFDKTFVELRNADLAAYKDKENFERHKKDVIDFATQLKAEGKKIIVIVFPAIRFIDNYPAEDIHKTMDQIFNDQGLTVIDLLNDLKGKHYRDIVVSQFDYHPNESVQKIAAQRLYEQILPLLNTAKQE